MAGTGRAEATTGKARVRGSGDARSGSDAPARDRTAHGEVGGVVHVVVGVEVTTTAHVRLATVRPNALLLVDHLVLFVHAVADVLRLVATTQEGGRGEEADLEGPAPHGPVHDTCLSRGVGASSCQIFI